MLNVNTIGKLALAAQLAAGGSNLMAQKASAPVRGERISNENLLRLSEQDKADIAKLLEPLESPIFRRNPVKVKEQLETISQRIAKSYGVEAKKNSDGTMLDPNLILKIGNMSEQLLVGFSQEALKKLHQEKSNNFNGLNTADLNRDLDRLKMVSKEFSPASTRNTVGDAGPTPETPLVSGYKIQSGLDQQNLANVQNLAKRANATLTGIYGNPDQSRMEILGRLREAVDNLSVINNTYAEQFNIRLPRNKTLDDATIREAFSVIPDAKERAFAEQAYRAEVKLGRMGFDLSRTKDGKFTTEISNPVEQVITPIAQEAAKLEKTFTAFSTGKTDGVQNIRPILRLNKEMQIAPNQPDNSRQQQYAP
jgi:hypothetical protein